jgi:hypothetical protein
MALVHTLRIYFNSSSSSPDVQVQEAKKGYLQVTQVSSRTLRPVALAGTDVSEELKASIRLTRISEPV